jgi:predicted nucleotidyltransferase component of viral defense system
MNLFDHLVTQAMQHQAGLAPLRGVVEKELLHHDILREMSTAGFLDRLTFIGGTCLRACYGSQRLSADLGFTGGKDFSRKGLADLAPVLVARLHSKYGLQVTVGTPQKQSGNVDTWKMKIHTRPEQPGIAAQKINIDICAIPSYDRRPMMLRNHYHVEMGTSGLIIQAQSREEILADKLVALGLRANRLKNRDLWDIGWLKQQGVELPLAFLPAKLRDRHYSISEYCRLLGDRHAKLQHDPACRLDFIKEMRRFLPVRTISETIDQEEYWDYLTNLIGVECDRATRWLTAGDR